MKKRENELTKICSKCDIEKELNQFYLCTTGVLGTQGRCKVCHKIARREYVSRNPQKTLVFNLRRMGLTVEEYEQMSILQNGVCAVCEKEESTVDKRTNKVKRLSIDHDHSCHHKYKGACKSCIRGLLCQRCNQALGLLKEDHETILKLAIYLKKFQ